MVPQRETGLARPILCDPPSSTSREDPENRGPLPQLPSPGLDFPICNMADSDTVSHSGREVGGEGPPHQ